MRIRIGLAIVVAIYLVYSSFGIAHPCLWGHMGHHEAEYMMRVRTTFRHHMVTPATHAGYDVPPWNDYYFHHPIGYHHALGLFTLIVGDHIWTPTLFPALTGLFTIWALFALVRRWWSREAGLLAVAVWVGLPIITSFSILTDAMLPAMACSILTVHAYLEYTEKPSWRWLKIALIAQAIGGLLFWEAYFQAFFHGLMVLGWWATQRGRAARLGRWPAAVAWFVTTGALAVTMFVGHFVFLWAKGMWADFFISFSQRHSGNNDFIIERHKLWLKTLYGWPLLALGALWLAVFLIRVAAARARKRDQAVLIFFVINSFYIYLFKHGSALHLYRVFWYSTFLVLAVTDLAVDLRQAIIWVMRPRIGRWVAAGVVGLALVAYFNVEGRHAYKNLIESREVMGTHTQPYYNADYPKMLYAMEVAKRTGPEDHVLIHNNLPRRVEFWYYVDRTNVNLATLAAVPEMQKSHPRAVVLMDGFPAGAEKKLLYELLKKHPATLWDRYLMLDLRSNEPGVREYQFRAKVPNRAWRWFVSHKYPPMSPQETVTMYSTCAYAATLTKPPAGQAEPPRPSWNKPDHVGCWHNYQIARGKKDLAEGYRGELEKQSQKLSGKLPFAHLLAARNATRAGAELWLTVDEKPGWQRLRFVLQPVTAGKPTVAAHQDLGDQPLADALPGQLVPLKLSFNVPPGKYRLVVEPGLPYLPVEAGLLELK